MKVKISERFSDLDLARMFNIDLDPHKQGYNHPLTGDVDRVTMPLWRITRKPLKRGERNAMQTEDNLRNGVSQHPPGSAGRIEDLAAYYATQMGGEEQSAFE